MFKSYISDVASFLPEEKLTNSDFEKMIDTTDAWIYERTGIRERRISPKDKPTSWMATKVAEQLIAKSSLDIADIDGILMCTVTPDMFFPNTANVVAKNIGASGWSYDSIAACSGFLYGLYQASCMIESGRAKHIMVIGADKMSSIVDYTDRTTCILFGDAAAGVIVSRKPEGKDDGLGILDFIVGTLPDEHDSLYMKAGGSWMPATHETVNQKLHYLHQEGQIVFKKAVRTLVDVTENILKKNNLTVNDIDWLVPHQANKRIIELVGKELGIDNEKVICNIGNYGNTTAATIPLCLADYEKQFKKGDKLVMISFGGGFTYGATYLKWAY